jgi:hypothetical protein
MNIIDVGLEFRSLSYGNNPKKFIQHHAEAKRCTIEDIHQWHLENGWAGCGYHFLVRKDGSVYRGRPTGAIGSHCKGQNAVSLGICAEGDYMTETMPDVQKNSIIELIKYLSNQYGELPILGHAEAMNFGTSCPGTNYPLQDIKNLKATDEVIIPKTDKLKLQIQSLEYWLNVDYNAKLTRTDGTYTQNELYPNLEAVGNIIVKGHKSHLVQWIQQKLIMWGFMSKKRDTGVYDEPTFQAVTNLQKAWQRETSGKLLISNRTWQIFIDNE